MKCHFDSVACAGRVAVAAVRPMMIEAAIAGVALGAVHVVGKAGVIPHYGSTDHLGAGPRFWLFWIASLAVVAYAGAEDAKGGLLAACAFWGGFMAGGVTSAAVVAVVRSLPK
jgi:hypothetical protein